MTDDVIRKITYLPEGKEYDPHIHTAQIAARAQVDHLIEELEPRAIFIYPYPPYV